MGEHTDFQSVALPVELPGPKGPDVARLGRTTQTKTARRTASRRYYYLAYLSCGLTPAEARRLQQANLRRARVLIRGRKAVCS